MSIETIVVGGGPAGAIAAGRLAERGVGVILLEQSTPSAARRSGEYIPKLLLRELPALDNAIIQDVTGLVVIVPGAPARHFDTPGFIVDRRKFNAVLINHARAKGCHVYTQTRAVIEHEKVVALRNGERFTFAPTICIGADGSNSRLRKRFFPETKQYVVTLVREVNLSGRLDASHVFFHPAIFGGYAWLFPMADRACCGVGVDIIRAADLNRAWQIGFAKFRELGLVESGPVFNQYYNMIYSAGPVERCVHKNTVLVGDAAGQIHPITGAGIAPAVVCGQILAEKCREALGGAGLVVLEDYEEAWRSLFAGELLRGARRRLDMLENWDRMPFNELISRHWVSFHEYYRS